MKDDIENIEHVNYCYNQILDISDNTNDNDSQLDSDDDNDGGDNTDCDQDLWDHKSQLLSSCHQICLFMRCETVILLLPSPSPEMGT